MFLAAVSVVRSGQGNGRPAAVAGSVWDRRSQMNVNALTNKFYSMPRAGLVVLLLSVMTLSGCATAPDASDPEAVAEHNEINDPIEPTTEQTE